MADHRTGNRDRGSSIFSDDGASSDHERDSERWRSDRSPQNQGDDRGFFSKAGDEVRSWFGDDEAEHRREEDARRWEREHGETGRYRGGRHEDQWRGGPVDEDRGYAGTGRSARDREESRFAGGRDRDDRGGYGQGSGQPHGQSRDRHNQGAQQAGGQQGGKFGQGQYGQSSFGEGNHGNTGTGQWSQGESHSGWDTYGQPETPQSGRYGQIGQPSYGQQSGANRDQFGHYGSEQDYGRAGRSSGPQGGRFGGSPHDESYRRWRDQQMEALDRDYEEYCRHRQTQFDQEFHGFRQGRAGQQDQGGAGQSGPAQGGGSGQQSAGATSTAGGTASATTSSTGSSGDADAAGKDIGGKSAKS